MKPFYHHVGQVGSSDFDKTVFKGVSISVVEENIPRNNPLRKEIIETLHAKFPSGFFNCWGVPEGAKFVIQNLVPGDCVLLVESVHITGRVPALCPVEAFWKTELRTLSKALWGNDKFPYIFFFRTEEVHLTWLDLLDHFGYKENFDPRGKFYSVADTRLGKFGNAEKYIHFLHSKFSLSKKPFDIVTAIDLDIELEPEDRTDIGGIRKAIEEIKNNSLASEPKLKEGSARQLRESYILPRKAGFVIAVRRLYGYRCAFCGVGLRAPNGRPEVHSAHIYPKQFDGSDDVRNGICVCRRHHWAFDVGWMALADDYTVILRGGLPTHTDYEFIRELSGKRIHEPVDTSLMPHSKFLQEHRKIMKFD